MNRRGFVALVCASLLAPRAIAQGIAGKRRIGVLMGYAESDPQAQERLAAFKERLAALGWSENRNIVIDVRWGTADVARASAFATELAALRPEVIVSNTTPVTAALQRAAPATPIVFVAVSDPIGSGFVRSLARPGGRLTGLINLESSLVEKWAETLKAIAPRVTRAAVMFNPGTAPYVKYYWKPLEAVAPRLGMKVFPAEVRSEADIEKVIAALGREPGSGLIAMTDSFLTVHRKSIIAQAARYKVPAIYWFGSIVDEGGLIAYGIDYTDLFRRAAPYVDRILRGAKPADLPVEMPTTYELAINRKTATALGLTIPQSLLLRADKVIE
jgi:putative ABC transport system substrate-binding protein